ncbi:MAG: sugar phosphate isomerase/epimerase family protein [Terriglobales bacterium]
MSLTRRRFLATSAFTLAALRTSLGATNPQRIIGFSTLGCPAWEWTKILDFAQGHNFSAFELRGLQGTMDLPTRPEFQPDRLAQSKRDVAAHDLKIACVSSSAQLHDADPDQRKQQIADAKRFIDLAAALGAPFTRVFGNKIEGPKEAVVDRVASGLHELGAYAGERGVVVIIESHGDFTDSPTLSEIFTRADSPHVGLLWDAHHTFVDGKEDPEFTVRKLGSYIRHTHLKDSVATANGRHYVLTGRGDVPVRKQVEVLAATGYKGCYTFEWEKVWHPDLEEPEIAFADYAEFMRTFAATGSFVSTTAR